MTETNGETGRSAARRDKNIATLLVKDGGRSDGAHTVLPPMHDVMNGDTAYQTDDDPTSLHVDNHHVISKALPGAVHTTSPLPYSHSRANCVIFATNETVPPVVNGALPANASITVARFVEDDELESVARWRRRFVGVFSSTASPTVPQQPLLQQATKKVMQDDITRPLETSCCSFCPLGGG